MTFPLFVSTAIPYVNAAPHLGFAWELVLADAIARKARQDGRDVFFLTGTDDNAISNVRAAEAAGQPVADLVAENSSTYGSLKDVLDVSWDDFIRTSKDPRHLEGAPWFFERARDNGDIYKKFYRGRYCVGCEAFVRSTDLVDGRCPDHRTEPEVVEEENYFFRLSKYGPYLREIIEEGRLRIEPAFRANEILAWLDDGLEDISISRSVERTSGWGIGVPGDPRQTLYVWFDALTNYVNALGGGGSEKFERFWASGEVVHVIGKNIVRQHALFWPAILKSAGLRLPDVLVIHGFITNQGRKLSKSTGNVIDPTEIAADFGADVLRYFLLSGTYDGDISYSDEVLIRARDGLANGLGNLLSRTVALIERHCGSTVPAPGDAGPAEHELRRRAEEAIEEAAKADLRPSRALAAIDDLVSQANRYIVEVAPWDQQVAEPGYPLETALFHLAETLRIAGWGLEPYLPTTSKRIASQLGADLEAAGWGLSVVGSQVRKSRHLFPKDVEPRRDTAAI